LNHKGYYDYVKPVNLGGMALTKSAYTDEEIKNVFQALFNEKKKLKELEQQLDQMRKSAPATSDTASDTLVEENNQLRLQMLSLRAKYDEAIKAAPSPSPSQPVDTHELQTLKTDLLALQEDRALLEEENKAFLKQINHLKSLISKLQEEAKQAQQEAAHSKTAFQEAKKTLDQWKAQASVQVQQQTIALHDSALQQDNEALQQVLAETEAQSHRQKLRLEKLAEVIQEKEKQIQELSQYKVTHRKTAEQKHDLQTALENLQQGNEQLQAQLLEKSQHVEQLERVIKFLRDKSEENLLASKQFKDDFEVSQESVNSLKQQLHDANEQLTSLKHTILHTSQDKEDLQEELQVLHSQLEIVKRSSSDSQKDSLKLETALREAQKTAQQEQQLSLKLTEQINQQAQQLEVARKEIDLIKQALIRGMKEANEIEARFKESVQEKVAALSKFHHVRHLLEKQELETHRLQEELKQAQAQAETRLMQTLELCRKQEEASQEALQKLELARKADRQEAAHREEELKSIFEEERQRLQRNHDQALEKLHEDMQQLKEEYTKQADQQNAHIQHLNELLQTAEAIEIEKKSLQNEYATVKEKLNLTVEHLEEAENARKMLEAELHSLTISCQEKERDRGEIQGLADRLAQERKQLQDLLMSTQTELEEKDADIKMAQQHLAKKVKEGALLTEELEKSRQQAHDLQHQQVQSQIRMAELQASLDIHIQQEQRLQDQLTEVVRTYDSQVKKWEQKYFEMQDRWQATELRKKELEKLEEKHQQMQALLANLGNVLGGAAPPSPPLPPPPRYEAPPRAEPELQATFDIEAAPLEPLQEEAPPKPYQNLFNMPRPSEKRRDNLFD
jgi:chromosome segregation ATPase